MKESYYRLVLHHFLKYPSEMLNNMNDDGCEEKHEKIVSNIAWSENFYVSIIWKFYYNFKLYIYVVKPKKELVL